MSLKRTFARGLAPLLLTTLVMVGCSTPANKPAIREGKLVFDAASTRLTIDKNGGMTVALRDEAKTTPMTLPEVDPGRPAGQTLVVNGEPVAWEMDWSTLHPENDSWVVEGHTVDGPPVTVRLEMRTDPASGAGVEIAAHYVNKGNDQLKVDKVVNYATRLDASINDTTLSPTSWWAFLGGSYENRFDWLVPLSDTFARENWQGMNAPDYGGGIPAWDIWTQYGGVLVASVSPHWRPISLPVKGYPEGIDASVQEPEGFTLDPEITYDATPLLLLAHHGDAYDGLHAYGRVMEKHGLNFPTPPASAFDPMWCAWGYERGFTPDEIYGTLPKVKELGYKWAGVDDGYQTYNGDWDLKASKFPGGDKDMEALVDTIHTMGLKAMLWWVPGDAAPGSRLVQDHPDWVVKNKDGSPATISWWDTYYLDPTNPNVLSHERKLVDKFIGRWGYDGLKTDGQCFNLVPPDYGHHPENPDLSSLHSPDILKAVYEEAKKDKPDAVLHNCPCGTVFSLYNMPYTDQYVASDPLSSWQIRTKNMVLRAIVGDKISFYGDHVELSTGGDDFASTVGMGGVPGSKFIWPNPKKVSGDFLLTPEREQLQRHWLKVYEENRLSKAHYRSLYVLGFDSPETHAFEKDGTMYYSFYADNFSGPVQLRGLDAAGTYHVVDYDRGKDYGDVTGPLATIDVNFTHHLLLKATPK